MTKAKNRFLPSTLLLFLWFVFALPLTVLAERIEVEGVPFTVDQLQPLEAGLYRITVLGKSSLVAKDTIAHTVVSTYFATSGGGARLSLAEIRAFISNSLRSGSHDFASMALMYYMQNHDLGSDDDDAEWIASIAPESDAIEAFKDALMGQDLNSPEVSPRTTILVPVLLEVALRDLTWLRTNSVRLVFVHRELFQGLLVEYFARAIQQHDVERTQRLLSVSDELWGGDDFSRQLRLLSQQATKVGKLRSTDEILSLGPLASSCVKEPLSEKIVCPLIHTALLEGARRALQEGKADQAINILARADFNRRTPDTHALVLEGIQRVVPGESPIVRDVQSEALLRSYSLVDDQIRAAYVRYLEKQLDFFIAHSQVAEYGALLGKLVALRPDPDTHNDTLRVEYSLLCLAQGLRSAASDSLKDIQTGISLYDRLQLALSGLYVNRFLAIFLLVFVVLGVVWFMQHELRRLRATRLAEEQAGAEELGAPPHSGYGRPKRVMKLRPEYQEYIRFLGFLELNDGASLREIKSAYRLKVKVMHPDARSEGAQASQEFIELTQAYDRILELRESLGLKDE